MKGPHATPPCVAEGPSHFSPLTSHCKKENPGGRSTPGWSGRTTPPSNAAHGHNLCQRASGFRTDPARQVDRGFQIATPTLAAGHHCNQPWCCYFLGRSSPLCLPHPNTRDYHHLILSCTTRSVPASTQLDASVAGMVARSTTEFGEPFPGAKWPASPPRSPAERPTWCWPHHSPVRLH